MRARWPSHVVRRALDDVMSGLQPTWPDVDAERVVEGDHRTVEHAVNARNACELYTQRLADVIGSKVKLRCFRAMQCSVCPSVFHTRSFSRNSITTVGTSEKMRIWQLFLAFVRNIS